MAQEVVTNFSFNPGDSVQKVGSVRTEIRQLKEALLEIPKDDPQWPVLFKRYSDLQGQVRELNRLSKALDPHEQINGYLKLGEAGVGAFTAMKGAANLFGVSNENVLKNLEEVESAMAVLRGLKAFDEGLKTARAMYQALRLTSTATKATSVATKALGQAQTVSAEGTKAATTATKGFGLALKGIGIGLIIAAIAYLVDNWENLKKQFQGLLPSVGNLSGSFDKFKQILVGVGSVVLNIVVTPIKLFINSVKTAIQVFEDIKGGHWGKIFTDIGEGIKQGAEIVKEGFDVVKHFREGEAASAAAQQEERDKKALELTIKSQEERIEVLKAAGKETYELELDLSHKKQKLYKDDKEKLEEALQEERVLRATHGKELEDEAKKAAEKAAEAEKKEQERQEKIEEDHFKRQLKIAEEAKEEATKLAEELLKDQQAFEQAGDEIGKSSAQKKLEELEKTFADLKERSKGNFAELMTLQSSFEKQKAALVKEITDQANAEQQKKYQEFIKRIQAEDQNILKSEKNNYAEKIAALKKSDAQIEELLRKGVLDDKTALEAKKVNAQIEQQLNKQVAESKKNEVAAIGGALNALSGIVNKNSVAGKAIAVGQATINTFQGATLALASAPPPYSFIEAAAVVAAGLVSVDKIIKTKVAPGDSTGGSTPGTGGAALQFNAPSVPQTSQTTNLSQDSISSLANAQGSQNQQVFVAESDISGTQARVSEYNQASTLGH